MTERLKDYIKEQTCATICCIDEEGKPYCFNCFYAFNPGEGILCFKSSADTRHSVLMKKNPFIAGTILPDKLNVLLIKGVQFEGILLAQDHPLANNASGYYHRKHPMALVLPGEIWTIQINNIKMTDSSVGFGKKIKWNRKEQAIPAS